MRIKIFGLGRIILSAALFWNISQNAVAADMSALNFNGDLIGKVIPDGSVINFNNELVGHITADGFVLNEDNSLAGGIVPQGIAISYNNSILGKVNNDGSVTSINDNLVGKVLPNGLVVMIIMMYWELWFLPGWFTMMLAILSEEFPVTGVFIILREKIRGS